MALFSSDPLSHRDRLERLRAYLLTERASFDEHWRDLSDHFFPRRARFQSMAERNKGDKRSSRIVDTTPRLAARTLQSGMHAGLMSPARPWMKLDVPDPGLSRLPAVKAWLHDVTRRMLDLFSRSNLYNALPIIYGDMAIFGTSAMSVLSEDKDGMRCYTYPLGTFTLGLDRRCMPTTFFRDYVLTARQLVEEFGLLPNGRDVDWSRFPMTVKDAWDKGLYEQPFEVTWAVTPNDDRRADSRLSRHFQWKSCHYLRGGDTRSRTAWNAMLRISGFQTFPLMMPRWDVAGEDTYGTDCPGMTALGDTRALQTMQKRKAQAIEKMVNPPLVGPEALRTQKTSLLPGDITHVDEREGMKGLRPIHEVKPDLSAMAQDIEMTQFRVRRAFYEDLLLMLASQTQAQPVTAREVQERHEEKLLAIGPVLERTNDELLDPLVDRTFAMMAERRMLPPPPEELLNTDLKMEYTSLMAQAQKLVGVAGVDRFLTSSMAAMQAFPEVRHKVRIFPLMNDYADMLGVNPNYIATDEDAQAALDAERQAAADAQQAETLKAYAQGAHQLGTTPTGAERTALTDVLGGAA